MTNWRDTPEKRQRACELAKQWARDHREHCTQRNKAWEESNKAKLDDYKAERGCSHCSESDPRCLDFHHRDPAEKEFDIAKRVRARTLASLMPEIAKCDILCANCHRKLHWH